MTTKPAIKETGHQAFGSDISDLKSVLSSAIMGEKDPVTQAKEDFAFYLENVIRDEREDADSEFIKLTDLHHRIVDALTDPTKTFVLIECPRGAGKALALDTPVPTPNGWTTQGELVVGDQVFDEHGQPTQVVAITETMTNHQCYEVIFSDGEFVIADADHLWKSKGGLTTNTQRIHKQLLKDSGSSYSLPKAISPDTNQELPNRRIIDIAPVASVPVACIQVANPSGLYLVGESMVPTHNSSITNAWLAWVASNNPNIRCVLVAQTDDQSMSQLSGVETILRSPEHQRIFGNLIPRQDRFTSRLPWSSQVKTLVRKHNTRFPTFLAIGKESQLIEGHRSDIVSIDDLIDFNTAISPTKNERAKDWVYRSLLPTRDPRGSKTIVIGTPKTKGDVYDHIYQQNAGKPNFVYIHQPALIAKEPHAKQFWIPSTWKSYWPEVFPVEHLLRIREEDIPSFGSQYMLERVDVTKAMFRREWLHLMPESQIPPRSELTIYQGIDSHGGKGDPNSGDFLALATIGIDKDGLGYLLDLLQVRGDVQTVFSKIRSAILEWQPKIISMEVGSNQYHFKNHLEQELNISINGVLTKNLAKEVRIREMASHFANGSILVASYLDEKGDFVCLPNIAPFVEQWEGYPNVQYDDALDSVNIALDPIAIFGVPLASAVMTPEMLANLQTAERLRQKQAEDPEEQEYLKLKEQWQRQLNTPQQRYPNGPGPNARPSWL